MSGRSFASGLVVLLFAVSGASAQPELQRLENLITQASMPLPIDHCLSASAVLETWPSDKPLPTFRAIVRHEILAEDAAKSGGCAKAIPHWERLAKDAEALAFLVYSSVRPGLRGSPRGVDTEDIFWLEDHFRSQRKHVVRANYFLQTKSAALVSIGECHLETGKPSLGAAYLLQALRCLDLSDRQLWHRARDPLLETLGVSLEDSGATEGGR
ncbi:MAG: hypothetical protein AAF604_08075 [Acidobacteriota bacterium]